MLKNTFCHIPGVGLRSERRLWDKGILSWDSHIDEAYIPRKTPVPFEVLLRESKERLKRRDPAYFAGLLPAKEEWRLFAEFRSSVAYLDIETNGYAGHQGYITAISLYDGEKIFYYIRGENLDNFRRDILKYKLIVTYNGKCFDIPFIESHMSVKMPQAHIDLRYILRDLGFKGGLKGCEKKLGIDRGELDGLDGYFAVLLWKDYKRNKNRKALETLVAYNIQDVVNLEPLMVTAYNLKLAGTPFDATHREKLPSTAPELPFKPDMETIERINSGFGRYSAAGTY